MGIDPAEPEGADGGAARGLSLAFRPRPGSTEYGEGTIAEIDLAVRGFKVGGWRQRFMLQRQQDLDQAGRTGCRQQMTDIALNRPENAGLAVFCLPPGGRQTV